MTDRWLKEAKEQLETEARTPSTIPLERLRAEGMIDEHGQVTGHLHRWTAYLAITAEKRADERKAMTFRCLKPVFGMPGSAEIDVSRESLVRYLQEGKTIITATRDERLGMWRQGGEVRLSEGGFVISGSVPDGADNLGAIPKFQQTTSKL